MKARKLTAPLVLRERKRQRDVPYQAHRRHVFKGFLRLLKTASCGDCGRTFPPCAMEFDHTRGSHRYSRSSSAKIGGCGVDSMYLCRWEVIVAEINKCDIVCAVCHKIRTHQRMAA